ncbi:MAG TPA: hypothetical protein VHE55_01430 [Fimbriimonadaceae bacterium]|nr:hypothetical protein [Fimbriimonadaceae bacterium]
MTIGGAPSVYSSVLTAMQSAGAQMDAAANSVASGDLDDLVNASLAMSTAKVAMGAAAQLARTADEMSESTLNMLV